LIHLLVKVIDGLEFGSSGLLPQVSATEEFLLVRFFLDLGAKAGATAGYILKVIPVIGLFVGTAAPKFGGFVEDGRGGVVATVGIWASLGKAIFAAETGAGDGVGALLLELFLKESLFCLEFGDGSGGAVQDVEVGSVVDAFHYDGIGREGGEITVAIGEFADAKVHRGFLQGVGFEGFVRVVRFHELT